MTASHRLLFLAALVLLAWVLACMVRAPVRDLGELTPATAPGVEPVIYQGGTP